MVSQTFDNAAVPALLEENNQLRTMLNNHRLNHDQTVRQLQIYAEHNDALQAKISNLERELRKQNGTLRQEVEDLSRVVAEIQLHDEASIQQDLAQLRYLFDNSEERQDELRERELLFQQVEGLESQTQKWKNEAFGEGNKAVSICWQASVDQALMRERAKDSWVIKNLQHEIQTLRAEKFAEKGCEAESEAPRESESLLVKSLRAEIELLKGCSGNSTSMTDPWQE